MVTCPGEVTLPTVTSVGALILHVPEPNVSVPV
jgi:hypothetical protein